jgi:hypothetical protein
LAFALAYFLKFPYVVGKDVELAELGSEDFEQLPAE